MELLCFLISIFVINFLNLFSLLLIIFSFLMCRYYYKKYLLKNKYNIKRKRLFNNLNNNYIVKGFIYVYNYFNYYFNIILEEVYKMFYDLIFEIITNNYKKNFQMKKTDNFKIKKINNCNLVNKTNNHNLIQKIKDENELNTILDDALKEILD